jgi:hypothetical protein
MILAIIASCERTIIGNANTRTINKMIHVTKKEKLSGIWNWLIVNFSRGIKIKYSKI